MSEAYIQALVHEHPACLPIAEIDAMFSDPVPICTELNTPAGSIDNFMVTSSGLPVLVECKLWRNPEARREVVSQILDYAKELSRWSSSDVQREVSHRLKRGGNPLLDMVRAADPLVDEQQFNDALTANLRRGRFLLLIVGDGIREGVERIAEYLQLHAGLHFSLGLVELPIYALPNGDRLVVPRVLARTHLIARNVVAVPDGYMVEPEDEGNVAGINPDRAVLAEQSQRFWTEFIDDYLKLDDPEQPKPRPARLGYISLSLPAPTSCRSRRRGGLALCRILHGQYVMRPDRGERKSAVLTPAEKAVARPEIGPTGVGVADRCDVYRGAAGRGAGTVGQAATRGHPHAVQLASHWPSCPNQPGRGGTRPDTHRENRQDAGSRSRCLAQAAKIDPDHDDARSARPGTDCDADLLVCAHHSGPENEGRGFTAAWRRLGSPVARKRRQAPHDAVPPRARRSIARVHQCDGHRRKLQGLAVSHCAGAQRESVVGQSDDPT